MTDPAPHRPRRPAPSPGRLLACAATLCAVACSPATYAGRADREVARLVAEKEGAALADRFDWVQRPVEVDDELLESEEDVAAPTAVGREGATPQNMDLTAALDAGVSSAREYLTRRESLFLQGLSLSNTRFDFGPQLDATVSHVWSKPEGEPIRTGTTIASARASQILSTGGTASVTGLWSTTPNSAALAGLRADNTTLDFNLSQPLMRGAGYTVSHEPLTQGERDLMYEVRDFELFRQDFSISIAQDYFNLVSQRTQLSNEEQNYEGAIFDREKAEAFRQVDRNRDEDLFLARRRAIDAENRLLQAQTDYQLAVDTFRIRLGLPPSVALIIEEVEPPFSPVRLEPDSAVEVAIHNRLDLITARDRVVDAERRLTIAANGLEPDVNLDLNYNTRNSNPRNAGLTTYDASAGLSVEIPLQRVRERNAYRSSLISLDREKRGYELLLENTERDVRDRLRTLDRLEQQIDLQEGNILQEERAVAVTELRYESGDAENRDLLDARNALINAQNALIDLKVEHYISRLRLLRELGLLFIDDAGGMST